MRLMSGSTEVEGMFSGSARLGLVISLVFVVFAAGTFFLAGAAVWLLFLFVLVLLIALVAVFRGMIELRRAVEEQPTARALAPLDPTDEELAEAMAMVWPGMPSWALRLSVGMLRRDIAKAARAA